MVSNKSSSSFEMEDVKQAKIKFFPEFNSKLKLKQIY